LSGQEQTISVGILLIIAISGGAAINTVRNRFRRREQRESIAFAETKEVPQAAAINVDAQPAHEQER